MAGHFRFLKFTDQWANLYEGGRNYLEISKQYGCSTTTVRRILDGKVVNRSTFRTTHESFYNSLSKKESTGCLEWTGSINKKGYGMTSYKGAFWTTHRLSFFFSNGEFDKSLFVCHKCDNPKCCNPDHLFLGSCYDNAIDMVKKKRGNRMILEEKSVIDIIQMIRAGKSTMVSIAKHFGVHRSTIGCIKNNKSWKYLPR